MKFKLFYSTIFANGSKALESITVLNMYPSERAETQLLLSIVFLAK